MPLGDLFLMKKRAIVTDAAIYSEKAVKRHQRRTPCEEDQGLELCTHEPSAAKDDCQTSRSQARARTDPLQVQRKHGSVYTLTSDFNLLELGVNESLFF